jgi:hypothetical protein
MVSRPGAETGGILTQHTRRRKTPFTILLALPIFLRHLLSIFRGIEWSARAGRGVERSAHLNVRDDGYGTALMKVRGKDCVVIVRTLLSGGADLANLEVSTLTAGMLVARGDAQPARGLEIDRGVREKRGPVRWGSGRTRATPEGKRLARGSRGEDRGEAVYCSGRIDVRPQSSHRRYTTG